MLAMWGALPSVPEGAAEGDHVEVFGAVQQVYAELNAGAGRILGDAFGKARKQQP